MKILAIETSCDETSVAIVQNGQHILAHKVYSQIPLHQEFSGVVPELASRHHLETLLPLLDQTLKDASLTFEDIKALAITTEPGLMGSLLVGLTVAKTLSYALNKPLIPVNHIVGHVYAAFLQPKPIPFPFIALIVSGGHTLLTHFKSWTNYQILGTTIDDSVGEAYDKTAKLLDLGYPGGPIIDKLAQKGNNKALDLPLVLLNQQEDRYNFSYSGLKTAVVYHLQRNPNTKKEDIAAVFQQRAIEVLYKKTLLATQDLNLNRVIVAGGVAANSQLRKVFNQSSLEVYFPSLELCTDNAAMIGGLAFHLQSQALSQSFDLNATDKILTYKQKQAFRKKSFLS